MSTDWPDKRDRPVMVTEDRQVCGCCHKLKRCGMFVLQDGNTAWVCLQCREGR